MRSWRKSKILDNAKKVSKNRLWMKLDNAAMIFPGQNTRTWSNFFRFAITLKEKIYPELLRQALINILPRFPSFDVCMRKGLFWYYFETNLNDAPPVQLDIKNPCYRFNRKENLGFLFRVYYYENRISIDFFHALTDGYGASVFTSTLVAEYLRLKGKDIPACGSVLDITQKPLRRELEDSFVANASSKAKFKKETGFVYHRKGTRIPEHRVNITTGYINVTQLHELCRSKGVTITEYLSALLLYIHYIIQNQDTKKKKKVISVQVPINLRKLFDSITLRNFSVCLSVRIDPNKGEFTFDEFLRIISLNLRLQNSKKEMNSLITSNFGIAKNPLTRIAPLFLKNLFINVFFRLTGEQTTTAMFTNLGVVTLPDELMSNMENVMLMAGPGILNGARVGAATSGNTLSVTFANIYSENDIEREFFTSLVKSGVHVKIESNRN